MLLRQNSPPTSIRGNQNYETNWVMKSPFTQTPHPIIRAKYMQMPLCLPENTISGPIIPLMDVPGWDMEFPEGNMGVDTLGGCKPRVKVGKY